jgi:hypothetical protein
MSLFETAGPKTVSGRTIHEWQEVESACKYLSSAKEHRSQIWQKDRQSSGLLLRFAVKSRTCYSPSTFIKLGIQGTIEL